MTKQLLAGAAVLALMTGAAFAQTTETTTTRTTVTPLPPPAVVVPPPAPADSYVTRTERSTFGGASVETQKSYRSGPDGSVATQQSKVVRPDGSSETSSRTDWSTTGAVPSPVPPLPQSSTTVTTTTR